MKPTYLQRQKRPGKTLLGLLLLLSLTLLLSCQKQQAVELVFAYGPEDTGSLQAVIDYFNKAHKGEIEVVWKKGSRVSNEFYRELEKEFTAETPSVDVVGADVVWTSSFAKQGWVEDLSSRFHNTYNPTDFVEAALNSAMYQFRVWGVPLITDAGILFYRKDLLQKSGFHQPPATWSELREMAKKIQADSDVKHGFVFQGGNFEGGVTNACEYIWNAGGRIMIGDLSVNISSDQLETDENIVIVNSEEARQGLAEAYSMITEGVSPANTHEFRELECSQVFKNGEAVFMRTWPGVYGVLLGADSKLQASQIGVAALPVSKEGNKSYSCLGGWNLMVNARVSSEKKDAAWKFIQFMTDEAQQKYLAEKVGNLPSLRSLYESDDMIQNVPVIALARKVIQNTRRRPITASYMEIAPDIAWSFNEMLQGALTPGEAVETIQAQIDGALADN